MTESESTGDSLSPAEIVSYIKRNKTRLPVARAP